MPAEDSMFRWDNRDNRYGNDRYITGQLDTSRPGDAVVVAMD